MFSAIVEPVRVAGLGGDAIFICNFATTIDVEWLINGTALSSLQLGEHVEQTFVPSIPLGTLEFTNVPLEYNNTRIQCRANTTSDGILMSQNSTLLIQGL